MFLNEEMLRNFELEQIWSSFIWLCPGVETQNKTDVWNSSDFSSPKKALIDRPWPYVFITQTVHWPKVKLDPYCELQVLDLFQQELQKKQRSIPKEKLQPREVGNVSDTWESRCDFYAAIYRSGQLEIIQAALEEAKSRQLVFIEDNDLQVGNEGEEGEEEEEDDDAEDEVVDPVVKKPRIHWAKREGTRNGQGIIMSYLWNLLKTQRENMPVGNKRHLSKSWRC